MIRSKQKYKNYEGQTFGNFTAIRFTKRENNSTFWICKCRCGNEREMRISSVVSGQTKSCGCLDINNRLENFTSKSKYQSLEGKKFNRLTAIKSCPNSEYYMFSCDCGNKKRIKKYEVVNGRIKSCGCFNKEKNSIRGLDLTGHKFGCVTVVSYVGKSERGWVWECKCDCGNVFNAKSGDLRSGHKKSCGCRLSRKLKRPDYSKIDKYCWKCKETKQRSEFYHCSSRYDKLSPLCKPCILDANRESAKRNPETQRAKWNRRRNLELNAEGSFSASDIKKLYKKQNGLCVYCLIELESDYHVDHIIALARGGSNYPTNLQLLCPSCNSKKGAKSEAEFLAIHPLEVLRQQKTAGI